MEADRAACFQLAWRDAPKATRSFIVTCFDPDAPTPSGFWHWVAVDLPASVTSLGSGAGKEDGSGLPKGAFHCRNDYGSMGYGGPAPVEKLGVDERTSPAAVSFTMLGHTLGRAILTPTYRAS